MNVTRHDYQLNVESYIVSAIVVIIFCRNLTILISEHDCSDLLGGDDKYDKEMCV